MEQLRQDARLIFNAALQAADSAAALQRHVRACAKSLAIDGVGYAWADYDRVYVVGAGKASAKMALAVETLIGEKITRGCVNVKYGHAVPLMKIKAREAAHPVPDEAAVRGTEEIVSIVKPAGERDLIVGLFSGGGSALLTAPVPGISLADKQQVTELLLASGAGIEEINTVRKHMSQVKGGRLARLAHPATLVSLILSDVVGDRLDSIASGPTAADPSTFADGLTIFKRYRLRDKIPDPVLRLFEMGSKGFIEETVKGGDPVFSRVQNVIIGNNAVALMAARRAAESLGYRTLILADPVTGEARDAGANHAAIAKKILYAGTPVQPPACILSGGETTVRVRGSGKGGRNQEFALAFAMEADGLENVVLLSGGTDGSDGPTDAAGAIVDGTTVQRAARRNLDAREALLRNDSYRFLQAAQDLLVTGPTLTNVMDVQILLVA